MSFTDVNHFSISMSFSYWNITVDIYSTRNKITGKIITILKDTSLELSKASLLTPFYGTLL